MKQIKTWFVKLLWKLFRKQILKATRELQPINYLPKHLPIANNRLEFQEFKLRWETERLLRGGIPRIPMEFELRRAQTKLLEGIRDYIVVDYEREPYEVQPHTINLSIFVAKELESALKASNKIKRFG